MSSAVQKLIHLAAAGSGLSPELLSSPGGFLWWYLDLVNEDGDGLVVIWSFGLPFLPGYASSARRGAPQMPRERPSLNVSVYRGGELDFYLLQEFDPEQVQWHADEDGDRWRFGQSKLHSVAEQGSRFVELDLALDVPGVGETEVKVEVGGPGCCDADGHDPRRVTKELPFHDWTPLLSACPGVARVKVDGIETSIKGR